MGAHQRKPVALHIHDPKSHKSTTQKEELADAEITMGVTKFTAPEHLKDDIQAMIKWREITKIYKESGLVLVSSTDNGVLARYCQLHSEYIELIMQRRLISRLEFPDDDTAEILAVTNDEYVRERARRLWSIMEYFTCLDGLLKINDKINAKCKAILSVEDRIFLNPAAKVKTLPIKRKRDKADELGDAGFNV